MTAARRTKKATPAKSRNTLEVKANMGDDGKEIRRKIQTVLALPETRAVEVIRAAETEQGRERIDWADMSAELRSHASAVQSGDLSRIEAMLMTQANALESLFASLTSKGMAQSHMPNLEGFMRLALRAQSQCRATLETLASIKQPPVIFAKQANIAQGHQQVNNGSAPAPACKTISEPTELLESKPHDLDTRAPRTTSRTDPAMEAVGAVDRATD